MMCGTDSGGNSPDLHFCRGEIISTSESRISISIGVAVGVWEVTVRSISVSIINMYIVSATEGRTTEGRTVTAVVIG